MNNHASSGNYGISIGLTISAVLMLIHAVVDWLNGGVSQGDPVLWVFQIVIYFVASLMAANAQYRSQIDFDTPLAGVQEAGRGAAMIICVVMWGYIIVRSLVSDDPGMFGGSGLLPFCGYVLLDFVVSLAFGNFGGGLVVKQHQHVDTDN